MNASVHPTKAKIVNIRVEHHSTGMFVATSPDLKGLLVAKQDIDELHGAIAQAITEMFAVCGVDVLVTPAEDGSEYEHPWVAVPAEVAKRALAEA